MHYYKNYGLAIRGLQQHHPEFDAEDFDKKCDGALPLETLLHNGESCSFGAKRNTDLTGRCVQQTKTFRF